MRSITISDNDASALKEFYQSELAKAEERVSSIHQILAQISGRRKRGRPKASSLKSVTKKVKGRRGRPKGSKNKKRGPGRPKRSKNKATQSNV